MDFPSIALLGVGAFAASNIDDLIILMAFFANPRFPKSHIILGQYLGMVALIGSALVGSLVSLVIPHNLLGLIGLFPIAIGIKELLELSKKDDDDVTEASEKVSKSRWIEYLPLLTVAAITFSGGEEIGIYASVFATNNEVIEISTVVLIAMLLTGVWCAIAFYLVSRPIVAKGIQRLGRVTLPLVLIGIGIYILLEFFFIPSF